MAMREIFGSIVEEIREFAESAESDGSDSVRFGSVPITVSRAINWGAMGDIRPLDCHVIARTFIPGGVAARISARQRLVRVGASSH